MSTKLAEPPPPKGVSSEEWDRILQRGPRERFTKAAVQLFGKQAFAELTGGIGPSPFELIYEQKTAAVQDPELLAVASRFSSDPERVFALYEKWGGGFDARA